MSWSSATVTVAPASEPITLAQARRQCRVTEDDTDFDDELTDYIAAARNHIEHYTGTRLVGRTITATADGFADFASIPFLPLQSVSSLDYFDAAGDAQTIPTTVYDVIVGDLTASIALKPGQSWPALQPGSRITMTAIVGYAATPEAAVHAMKILVGDYFADHEIKPEIEWSTLDSLLCNFRVHLV